MGDGDGWRDCHAGHRHWGRHGAAGLFVSDGRSAILQHRAPWTHEGGTWSLPGGARDSHEDAVDTALREAGEEADLAAGDIVPFGLLPDEHGEWSYTTVAAHPRSAGQPLAPHAANAESTEVRWWRLHEIDELQLHRGFGATWPLLRELPRPLTLVIDAANVVGARPDGWWRDRLGATRRLRDALLSLARRGLAQEQLPPRTAAGALSRLLPRIVLAVEGAAAPLAAEPPSRGLWWERATTVQAARSDGDTLVVESAARYLDTAQVIVVSADRGLRERLEPGVVVVGPSWLYLQLELAEN